MSITPKSMSITTQNSMETIEEKGKKVLAKLQGMDLQQSKLRRIDAYICDLHVDLDEIAAVVAEHESNIDYMADYIKELDSEIGELVKKLDAFNYRMNSLESDVHKVQVQAHCINRLAHESESALHRLEYKFNQRFSGNGKVAVKDPHTSSKK